MNFLLIIYEIGLWLTALLTLPKMIYAFFVHKKYHKSLLPRLGCHFPSIPPDALPSIWVHAVSVGETKAVVSLARELKHLFPHHALIISSTTETGYAEALRSLPFADYHVYMPLDFRWVVRRVLQKAAPGLVVLCESDFWLNFLGTAKEGGATVALVNGKLSESSAQRFGWFPFFSRRLFSLLDVCCVQNKLYSERFIEVGVPTDRIVITGNLKFDEEYPQLSPEEVKDWRHKLGIEPYEIVMTVGSTHANEEYFVIQQLLEIWKKTPHLKVILVPRHPERFNEVAELLENENIFWINFTDINLRTGREQVILIDTMGMLRMCYQLSDFAVVCGSFTDRVGGHNILEPCWYGKPVLFGPHMFSQNEFVDIIKQYRAGIQIEPERLRSQIEKWLEDPQEREEIGKNGMKLVHELHGSTKLTLDALDSFFKDFSTPDMN